MILHKGLEFKYETEGIKENRLTKELGNVFADTEITFEYKVKDLSQCQSPNAELPFQVQVYYTKLDGVKCIRTITEVKKITFDRKKAEENIRHRVVAMNATAQSAKLAHQGHLDDALMMNYANESLLQRTAQNNTNNHYDYAQQYSQMANVLNRQIQVEQKQQQQLFKMAPPPTSTQPGVNPLYCPSNAVNDNPMYGAPPPKPSSQQQFTDESSEVFYNFKSPHHNAKVWKK